MLTQKRETPPNVELLLKQKNNACSNAETIFLINNAMRTIIAHCKQTFGQTKSELRTAHTS